MPFPPELLEELKLLLLFRPDTTLEGIKIHRSAAPEAIDAALRLHRKGLISHSDGGYLTELGRQAAEHTRSLLTLLEAPID